MEDPANDLDKVAYNKISSVHPKPPALDPLQKQVAINTQNIKEIFKILNNDNLFANSSGLVITGNMLKGFTGILKLTATVVCNSDGIATVTIGGT